MADTTKIQLNKLLLWLHLHVYDTEHGLSPYESWAISFDGLLGALADATGQTKDQIGDQFNRVCDEADKYRSKNNAANS